MPVIVLRAAEGSPTSTTPDDLDLTKDQRDTVIVACAYIVIICILVRAIGVC